VYVFCRTGDFSKEIAEELNDRGYDVYNVEGGYDAYEKYLREHPLFIDAKGLKCPGPIVKVADTIYRGKNRKAHGQQYRSRAEIRFIAKWKDFCGVQQRPKKVRVKKNIVEKMFGFMMPRGTMKLGLSRMNMFGMGPKMIRWIMKKHNILSLEELIQEAINHGVHLVACQMSMEIMGIRKEELIDGVELGGVSTFLGSGEQSDMSLFI
jgi:peroxiredoxin family protein